MTQKLTPEEKLANKKRLSIRSRNWSFMALVFATVGLFAALNINNIHKETALVGGMLGGIGYAMLMKMKI
jgi:hypothetical protein